jgi:uncharacterized protein
VSSDAVRARAAAYLRECHVMTLATCGEAGVWAAAVFYASEGFMLHFLSAPSARHVQNLESSPRVSATVQKDYSEWQRIRGVQLEGVARETDARERERVQRVYGEKFPIVARIGAAPLAIAKAFQRVRFYTLLPDRAYFVDNSRGFGHRDEIELPAP